MPFLHRPSVFERLRPSLRARRQLIVGTQPQFTLAFFRPRHGFYDGDLFPKLLAQCIAHCRLRLDGHHVRAEVNEHLRPRAYIGPDVEDQIPGLDELAVKHPHESQVVEL